MNAFDYFFENSKDSGKLFLLGSKETISYKELYEKCLRLAEYLILNIGHNKNVLIISPNSSFFLIVYLAVIKSGNIIAPLNPEIEQRNLDFILQKTNAELIFITSQIKSKINLDHIQVLDEIILSEIIDNQLHPFNIITSPANPDDLAEIIFTSGSTGEPKGVMISHRNLIANTESIVNYLKLDQNDIILVVLPFYYCYGLSLLHTHLRSGGSIVINNMFIMLGSIINDLKKYRCTGFAGVPSHFQILLRKSDSFKLASFPDLKYVTQAGGKLHNAFILEFIETYPDVNFNVMYGQTEATARLAWLPPDKLKAKLGSCGKAIPGVILKVVDENGCPVMPGQTGEIIAQGDNIMQGYYKDAESTARTIADGWLHTGDLATVDDEGYIYLTARKKEIIKVGGRRISPKEIEEVIVTMPDIVDCTIEGVFDEILGETMKATIIVKHGVTLSSDQVKAWCTTRIAKNKIPQYIEIQDKILISATGKKVKNNYKAN